LVDLGVLPGESLYGWRATHRPSLSTEFTQLFFGFVIPVYDIRMLANLMGSADMRLENRMNKG
jgi:hypothetical protein